MKRRGLLEIWQIRCLIENAKAIVPFQNQLRRFKQNSFGGRSPVQQNTIVVNNGLAMIEWLGNFAGANVLEIGSGQKPIIAILFSLAGAKVFMTDLHQLMHKATFCAALTAIRENRDVISERLQIAPEVVDHASRECLNLGDRLQELGLAYQAPCDCRSLALDSGSIDIVISRSVLEHVPQPVILDIFREAERILRPGGIMLHLIDLSDHWAHIDPVITGVNFLQYPDWLFGLTYINLLNYHNRLRHSEFLPMLESTKFTLKRETIFVDEECLRALNQMRIADRFRHFSKEELATTECQLLAEKPLS